MEINIDILPLPHAADLPLPSYSTEHSAGMDLLAAIDESAKIAPGARLLCTTGISIAIPAGYEGQIRPRSGLAIKHGITTLNTPGAIDADYRGEIKVILINHGHEEFTVVRGMRVAQLIISQYSRCVWQKVTSLKSTARGEGGFGSTGLA